MESVIIKKKSIINSNLINEKIVDITEKSIEYKDIAVTLLDSFYISEDMQMRPDLISHVGYGSTDYFDLILKFNGISNPYAIEKNTYIYIPELTWMMGQLAEKQSQAEKDKKAVVQQYIDSNKKVENDPRRQDYVSKVKQLLKNVPTDRISKFNLPPNLAEPGSTEISIKNNGVSLGESY